MTFAGRTVLITGAAGGLGRALCRSFQQRGADVLAVDVDTDALADLAAECGGIETRVLDLTDEAACADAFADRPVDIVVNNAGITHFSRFRDTDAATIRAVMAVNFFAAVNVTKAVLPALRRAQGTVVAISSVAGFSPLYGRTGYSASKHALHGFFDSLRAEVRDDGVNVLVVCPSFIATQARTRGDVDNTGTARPGSASRTAGRPLSPETVAEAVCEAVTRRRRLLVIGRLGKLSYWINKLSPRLFERLMIRTMKPEFDGHGGR